MIYFLDTEFNGWGSELISLALVPEKGNPLTDSAYYVMKMEDGPTPWVAENVMPVLWDLPWVGPRVEWTRTAAAKDLAIYLERDSDPVIVSDWPADIAHLCKLIEFPNGQMANIPRLAFRMARVDSYPNDLERAVQHNAWWDAVALRYKLTGKKL